MKVLILATWYPDGLNPVSGIFVKEQVKALVDVGVNPIVYYPYDKSVEKGKYVKVIEDGVITYRANTDYLKITKISRLYSIIKGAKILKKIVKENDIDLIHSHVCYTGGFIAWLYNKFYKVPYIITEHSSKVKEFANKIYNRPLFDLSYKNAQCVVTVSSYLAKELTNLNFKFKSKIIGNVVDTSIYKLNLSHNSDSKEFNLLFVGLMVPSEVKGLQYFIPALASFIKNNSQYKINFHLVGDGPKREKYENMCKELNIEDNCKFYGRINKELIPEFIEKSDFLVLPSLKETFGSVLIEAMAGGKPVLTTKCGGPNEFVENSVGVLVEPKSIEALEDGLKTIIQRYEEFHPNYIREYADNNFSYKAIGGKLEELYEEVLSEH